MDHDLHPRFCMSVRERYQIGLVLVLAAACEQPGIDDADFALAVLEEKLEETSETPSAPVHPFETEWRRSDPTIITMELEAQMAFLQEVKTARSRTLIVVATGEEALKPLGARIRQAVAQRVVSFAYPLGKPSDHSRKWFFSTLRKAVKTATLVELRANKPAKELTAADFILIILHTPAGRIEVAVSRVGGYPMFSLSHFEPNEDEPITVTSLPPSRIDQLRDQLGGEEGIKRELHKAGLRDQEIEDAVDLLMDADRPVISQPDGKPN
jgi:hypothetical protein